MGSSLVSPRKFIVAGAAFATAGFPVAGNAGSRAFETLLAGDDRPSDYTLHIQNSAIEIAPKRIISVVTYNGQFPVQEAEVDFVADNPGMTLFHRHQQLHLDFGFMTLFDYA